MVCMCVSTSTCRVYAHVCACPCSRVRVMSSVFPDYSPPCAIEVIPFAALGAHYSVWSCQPVCPRDPCLCLLNTGIVDRLPYSPTFAGF